MLVTLAIWPTWDPKSAAGTLPAITMEIMKLYEDTYKIPFVIDSLRGWDPLHALVQSIEAAQSFDPGDVIKAFENLKTIQCSVGTAKVGGLKTYGVNHMVVQPLPLTWLKNGEIEFIKWTELDIP